MTLAALFTVLLGVSARKWGVCPPLEPPRSVFTLRSDSLLRRVSGCPVLLPPDHPAGPPAAACTRGSRFTGRTGSNSHPTALPLATCHRAGLTAVLEAEHLEFIPRVKS